MSTQRAKFTPGPWHVGIGNESTDGAFYIYSVQGGLIAKLDTESSEKDEANANLIATATELLEACIALQMEAAARGCGLKIADDAISKAQR